METKGCQIEISGVVQGVGFRPRIHKKASLHALCGRVRNTTTGALLTLEGNEDDIDAFLKDLREDLPANALIEHIKSSPYSPLHHYTDFAIEPSEKEDEKTALIPPDLCICEDCLKELFDPRDRRYRYPFLNCTACGPRFTILKDVPYDRSETAMAPFVMCERCAAEYADIRSRRYHAQPDCCADCGPALSFEREGVPQEGDAIALCREALLRGEIVAVKGLGGFHLACLAENEDAVRRLRRKKERDHRPLALMCADTAQAMKWCLISPEEAAQLESSARPIVLLRKREKDLLPLISHNARIGIMLPYTPLHALLMADGFPALVMTSANHASEPMLYENEAAREQLREVADAWLLHDRDIVVPCDDSVLFADDGITFVRRSRGYVPVPLFMQERFPQLLATGGELKATFALSKDRRIFPGPHIGDLKNTASFDNALRQIAHMERLFGIRPKALACDLHPDFLSTAYAEERSGAEGIPLFRIQHHHAHLAGCMADNGLAGEVTGVIFDGYGYGEDGTAWGGEFLTGDTKGFTRRAHVLPFALPGGDKAVREITRIACSLLYTAYENDADEALKTISKLHTMDRNRKGTPDAVFRQIKAKVNCPLTTSAGRLFDGVAALLGICECASYEGEGAVRLESAAADGCTDVFAYGITAEGCVDPRPMIRAIVRERLAGKDKGELAARFMNTLADMTRAVCVRIARDGGPDRVVLSGGVFFNRYLTERIKSALTRDGLSVYTHRRVSPGDEGLSLGQLVIAAARMGA